MCLRRCVQRVWEQQDGMMMDLVVYKRRDSAGMWMNERASGGGTEGCWVCRGVFFSRPLNVPSVRPRFMALLQLLHSAASLILLSGARLTSSTPASCLRLDQLDSNTQQPPPPIQKYSTLQFSPDQTWFSTLPSFLLAHHLPTFPHTHLSRFRTIKRGNTGVSQLSLLPD